MRSKKPKTNPQPSSQAMVDKEALTRLAYELYVRRGGEHGHELEDWVMAELILVERHNRPGARPLSASNGSRRLEDKFTSR